MDEEIYCQIVEKLSEELGREPTEDEITNEYSNQCDWAYENYYEGDFDSSGDY